MPVAPRPGRRQHQQHEPRLNDRGAPPCPAKPSPRPSPSVRVPAGTTAGPGDPRRRVSRPPDPQAVVVVRDRDGRLRDLAWAPEEDADAEPVAADTEDGRSVIRHSAAHVLAQAVQQAFPDAKLGIGPPIRDGFYYDFHVDRPFTPEDLTDLDKRMRKIIKSGPAVLPAGGRLRRRRAGGTRGRAVQAGTGRPQERGLDRHAANAGRRRERRGRRRRADDLRQPARAHRGAGLGRPLPRSARADHPVHPGVPADPDRRRVLARKRQEPAAAADLRHRVGVAPRPWSATSSCSPRPSAATTAGSAPSSTCSRFPTRSAPGWRFSTRAAASCARCSRTTPGSGTSRRATPSSTPRTSARRSCSRSPGTSTGTRTACSRRCSWIRSSNDDGEVRKPGQDYYLKPMNCPMHTLIYRSPRPVVPRAAAAAVRVRLGVPVREVRRGARSHPGARA